MRKPLRTVLSYVRKQDLPSGWDLVSVGDLLLSTQYGMNCPTVENGSTAIVGMKDIRDGRVLARDLARTNVNKDDLASYSLKRGDLLINRTNSLDQVGKVGLVDADRDDVFASYLVRLRVNTALVDSEYLNYWLNSDLAQRTIKRIATPAVGQANINPTEFQKYCLVPLPPEPQRARIVEVLSTWDDAIDQLARLIEIKNERLRGMLAECVSDARQAAKSDDWERVTLDNVAALVQQRVSWDEQATYRLITVKRACGGLTFRGDRRGHEILTKDMYTVRAGDFLISKRQVVHGAWAMVSPEFDGAHVSKEYACLRAKPGKLWMPYFDWLSRTNRLQHEAFICSYGVDIEKMVLNVEWLLQTPLLLPRSIETQKAMAVGLDCLQREVQLLQAQMEALRRQKRGLMQKLLTGELRVPVRDGDVDAMAALVAAEAAQ
jgi:type I restriction enzyme S subunit